MNLLNSKIVKIIFLSLFVFLLIGIIFKYGFINPGRLKTNRRFTIGYITSITGAVNGGPDVNFSYKVRGKLYSNFYGTGGLEIDIKPGERYFVQFFPPDPLNANIMRENPVPDSIQDAPADGWSTEPWLKKTVVKGVVQSVSDHNWVKVCIHLGELELCDGGVNKDFNARDVGKEAYVRYSTVDSSVPWEVFKDSPE